MNWKLAIYSVECKTRATVLQIHQVLREVDLDQEHMNFTLLDLRTNTIIQRH